MRRRGFSYHRARYYAAWLGKWTSSDPAGLLDGVNTYTYVKGNPIRLSDPSGRNSFEDLFHFIRQQAGFEQGRQSPPTFQSSSGSPFGTAAHRTATGVVQNMQRIGFVNADRVVSEPVIVNGVIVREGSGPGGAPKGSLCPDLLGTNQGTQGSVVNQSASAVTQVRGDMKYGGGKAAAKYSQPGVPVLLVNGVTNSADTDPALLQMAPSAPSGRSVNLSPVDADVDPVTDQIVSGQNISAALARNAGGATAIASSPIVAAPSLPLANRPAPPAPTTSGLGRSTVAGVVRGVGGMIPGVAETEGALISGGLLAYGRGYIVWGEACMRVASSPAVVAAAVGGAVSGNLARAGASKAGASDKTATVVGLYPAAWFGIAGVAAYVSSRLF